MMRWIVVLLIWSLWSFVSLAQDKGQPSFDGISMDFQEASLKDVLKIFSQQSGLNFVADEKISDKKVTLFLDKVSVEDALYNIMRANQLTYEKAEDSDVFIVKEAPPPPEVTVQTMTKVYTLQYAQVSGAWGGSVSTVATDNAAATTSTSQEQATPSTGLGGDNIINVIESLLSDHGRLVSEKRTNSLIVTDIPEKFELIEKIIAELDVPVSQVAIEAEIIETVGTTLDRIGIEYGASATGQLLTVTGAKRETQFPLPNRLTPPSTKPGFTVGTLNTAAFTMALDLLSKDSSTKFLARPKVMTLNNQTAEIKISADTAVASITAITASEGTSQTTTQAERMETGIILRVTPQVNEKDRVVTMVVEPEVIRPEDSKFFSGSFVDPLRRKVKTTVMLRDNETLIMGGLIESQIAKSRRKVPLLGDIPLVGVLFHKKVDDTTDRELVVFVTPHIIAPGESRSALPSLDTHGSQRVQKVKEDLEAIELMKIIQEQ